MKLKFTVALVVGAAICTGATRAAADDFIFPGGVTFGTMAALAAHATPEAGPPPPPAPYDTGYFGYAGRGPYGTQCWIEPGQRWDGSGFALVRVRSCY
jgi:hypothetical protein